MVECGNCNQSALGGILVDVMKHIEGQTVIFLKSGVLTAFVEQRKNESAGNNRVRS
jgi:hypothetical protein